LSTNGAAAGADGLGGAGTTAPVRDDGEILEDPTYSDGDDFEMDPELTLGGPDGLNGPGGPATADPFEGWSDEDRKLAQEKGWKGPADAAAAYRGAQSLVGQRESDQVRALQDQLRNLEQRLQAPPQQQQVQQPGQIDPEQIYQELTAPVDWRALFREAEGDPATAFQLYHEHIVQPRLMNGLQGLGAELLSTVGGQFEDVVGRRLQPVEQGMTRIGVRDQAAQLASQFPEDFPRLQAEVAARLQRNPALLQQAGGMRAVFNDVLADDYSRRQKERRMGQEGETLGGGRGPSRGSAPQVDVDAEIRAGIESAGRSVGFDGL
jgi:hypothetical protein